MFGKKKDSRRELREVFRATEEIQEAETPRDADMATGYVLGIIDEKIRDGRLTIQTAEALGKMVEAVGENICPACVGGFLFELRVQGIAGMPYTGEEIINPAYDILKKFKISD